MLLNAEELRKLRLKKAYENTEAMELAMEIQLQLLDKKEAKIEITDQKLLNDLVLIMADNGYGSYYYTTFADNLVEEDNIVQEREFLKADLTVYIV